jgi:hypothetical protein
MRTVKRGSDRKSSGRKGRKRVERHWDLIYWLKALLKNTGRKSKTKCKRSKKTNSLSSLR